MDTRKNYLLKVAATFILFLIITALLIIPSKANSLQGFHSQTDRPYRVETFELAGGGSLDVETSGGSITVEGTSEPSVRVEMYVYKDGRELSPADTDLNNWKIDISQSGSTIKVIAKRQNSGWSLFGGGDNLSVSFVVYTPGQMKTDLNTSGGHISIRNLTGDQQLRTSGGHISLSRLKGNIEARTSGGHIAVDEVHGAIDVRTSGGNIDIQETSGPLKARTSGGNIQADLTAVDAPVELRTSGGNITLSLPRGTSANLNLEGSHVQADLSQFQGSTDRNEIEGKINGGGPEIIASTSGGLVSLSFE